MAAYVVLRPGLSVTLPRLIVEFASGPSTLSFGWTLCLPSGTILELSSFLPISGKLRPANDISNGLPGGPTAWEARLDSGMRMRCLVSVPVASGSQMHKFGSASPKGLQPLKMLSARPSQKLLKLYTALITVGAFRGSTRRTLTPLTLNPVGSGTEIPCSTAPLSGWPTYVVLYTPGEETTSFQLLISAELRSSGLRYSVNGNMSWLSDPLGPTD